MLKSLLLLSIFCATKPAPNTHPSTDREPWWKTGVIYQIYPRSFQDSSGDGIGDLPGVVQRLDYLKSLGITAIWLSPFFPSPMIDFGYDVSDYTGVDPMFGTTHDFTNLVNEAHARGIKVLIDFVLNHTSVEHPWFREARRDKTNAKRDWFVWANPTANGGPPNNWRGVFGGSAWTLDPATNQYYYHAFLPEQPDLNWRNPEVEKAMLGVMRFWLDRGVDGFRVDAIGQLFEDKALRDEPSNPFYDPREAEYEAFLHPRTVDLPETHAELRKIRQLLASYPGDRAMVTEAYMPFAQQAAYYGRSGALEANLPFNFHLIGATWSAPALATLIQDYNKSLPPFGWPNWVLSNHDRHRLATRLGENQARIAAMLLLTLRGTPTLYYGDELGMTDTAIPQSLVQDPFEKREPGKGLGRDPERTPMQWTPGLNAGFTSGKPWLPVNLNFKERNVDTEGAAPNSVLNLYRALLQLRGSEPALSLGSYRTVFVDASVLIYERQLNRDRYLIALNFSGEAQPLSGLTANAKPVLSTTMDSPVPTAAPHQLRPHEGMIFRATSP